MIQLARKARSRIRSALLALLALLAPLAASVRGSFKIGIGNGLPDNFWIAPWWIVRLDEQPRGTAIYDATNRGVAQATARIVDPPPASPPVARKGPTAI